MSSYDNTPIEAVDLNDGWVEVSLPGGDSQIVDVADIADAKPNFTVQSKLAM